MATTDCFDFCYLAVQEGESTGLKEKLCNLYSSPFVPYMNRCQECVGSLTQLTDDQTRVWGSLQQYIDYCADLSEAEASAALASETVTDKITAGTVLPSVSPALETSSSSSSSSSTTLPSTLETLTTPSSDTTTTTTTATATSTSSESTGPGTERESPSSSSSSSEGDGESSARYHPPGSTNVGVIVGPAVAGVVVLAAAALLFFFWRRRRQRVAAAAGMGDLVTKDGSDQGWAGKPELPGESVIAGGKVQVPPQELGVEGGRSQVGELGVVGAYGELDGWERYELDGGGVGGGGGDAGGDGGGELGEDARGGRTGAGAGAGAGTA